MVACQNKDSKDKNDEEASHLFTKSAELIISFTNQLENAQDSTSIDSIINNLEKKLVDLNFSFPPNTDLKLTEQENDSLYKLMQKYKEVRNKRLHNPYILKEDSIRKDSI